MKDVAASVYTALEFGTCVAAFTPVMGAAWLLSRGSPTQRIPGRLMRGLGRASTALTPLWKFRVDGTPPADIRKRPYVVISNHESNADPFLLSWLPWDMRWVQKQELQKMPLIGLTFKFSGDVTIRRGDGESIRKMMAECRRAIEGGISVMIFPEGKRSKTGELLAFRDGAFRLAIETGAPILPIAIAGTRDCLLDRSPWVGRSEAVARILSPISTEGLSLDDVGDLRERSRAVIARAAPELRREIGARDPSPSAP